MAKLRHRVLKNYGSLEELEKQELGAFERLRQEARDGIIGKKELEKLKVTYSLDEAITFDDMNYGWKLFDELYKQLEIEKVIRHTMETTQVEFDVKISCDCLCSSGY